MGSNGIYTLRTGVNAPQLENGILPILVISMKLFLLLIPITVMALEVIINPYEDVSNEIQVYTYGNDDCYCPDVPKKSIDDLFLELNI